MSCQTGVARSGSRPCVGQPQPGDHDDGEQHDDRLRGERDELAEREQERADRRRGELVDRDEAGLQPGVGDRQVVAVDQHRQQRARRCCPRTPRRCPSRNIATSTSAIDATSVATASASRASTTARSRLTVTTISRRSSRSVSAPAHRPKTSGGATAAAPPARPGTPGRSSTRPAAARPRARCRRRGCWSTTTPAAAGTRSRGGAARGVQQPAHRTRTLVRKPSPFTWFPDRGRQHQVGCVGLPVRRAASPACGERSRPAALRRGPRPACRSPR